MKKKSLIFIGTNDVRIGNLNKSVAFGCATSSQYSHKSNKEDHKTKHWIWRQNDFYKINDQMRALFQTRKIIQIQLQNLRVQNICIIVRINLCKVVVHVSCYLDDDEYPRIEINILDLNTQLTHLKTKCFYCRTIVYTD